MFENAFNRPVTGGWRGDPLDEPVAWYRSFSRTDDPDTAANWRAVLVADDESQPQQTGTVASRPSTPKDSSTRRA